MVLNDQVIPNHGLVFYSDIGRTAETSLRCVTRRMDCCSGGTGQDSDEEIAEWFNTRGQYYNSGNPVFIRSRRGEGEEFGYVNLRRKNYLNNEGIYHCIIPKSGSDSFPAISTFYVGIYNTGGGEYLLLHCVLCIIIYEIPFFRFTQHPLPHPLQYRVSS